MISSVGPAKKRIMVDHLPSIVITTNRPVGAWGEILGDTTVAAAMLDRLLHRSVVVTLDGGSYRLRNHHAAADELRRVTTGTNQR